MASSESEAGAKWDFEIPPDPVPQSIISETVTTDVLVIGAGTAGLPAAQRAREAGARVILIDKCVTSRWGGGDNSACNSRLHKKLGIRIDTDQVCLALQKHSENFANQALTRLWSENSGEYMDWLMDQGEAAGHFFTLFQVPRPPGFDASTEYYEEFPTCHRINGTMNQGLILKIQRDRFASLGGEIRFETRARQLVKDDHGVAGAIAQDKAGRYIRFNVNRAVVVATGDYGQNPAMMQKYCPNWAALAASRFNIYEKYMKELRLARAAGQEPNDTGDGHQMLLWAGGVMQLAPHPPIAHTRAGPFGTNAFLSVNQLGLRYHNEDVPGQAIANQILSQPGNKVYQIADSRWEEQIPFQGTGLMKTTEVNAGFRAHIKAKTKSADTIEGLAVALGLPPETLRATVDRYNALCAKGHDDDFGKRPDRMFPVNTPPYYGGQSTPSFLMPVGGLLTNNKLQMVDKDSKVIPGVYLAGNTVGGRFYHSYPTMCPGLSHGMAGTHGYLAGTWAAQG